MNKTLKITSASALLGIGMLTAGAVQQSATAGTSPPRPDQSFSILDRPLRASDNISSWRFPSAAERGLNVARARVVQRDSRKTVAVMPSNEGPCLATKSLAGQGLSCAPVGATAATVSVEGSIGVVPNSVTSVKYEMTDGTVRSGQVSENVWKAPIEARRVSFSLRGKTETIDLMPPSSLPDGAVVGDDGVVSIGGAPTPVQ